MNPQGSFRLFRFAKVNVFLHWSWFLVAAYEISARSGRYSNPMWNVLEYLTLFFIVLLHEYGHALACQQVGGSAEQIVLWPLGGVAYVRPPLRPGATLWSIAAGPLVNVALLIVLTVAGQLLRPTGWATLTPNLHALVRATWFINLFLLLFNMLPIYPLDGGQILRSLLWFVLGRARSMMVAVILGFLGVAGLLALAWGMQSVWMAILAVYVLLSCVGGWKHARLLMKIARMPRHENYACPECKSAPPMGELWRCHQCKRTFDTFQSQATCPFCSTQFPTTSCTECGEARPFGEWVAARVGAGSA